jgi:hypothetical protein
MRIYEELTVTGLKPTFQTMDNESSKALKLFLHSNDIQFQLVPPHVHQQNAAERAIQTFKNHFVAILCSTDKQFPIHLWDRLLPQAVLTLNLLRQSRINPTFSAHAQLNGPFDYNATPLAPPGTRVIIHEKPYKRGSWAPHGKNGWYVGPAIEHYRAHRVYCSTTGHDRISNTVEFPPQHCKIPGISSADAATIASLDLAHALQHPTPTTLFKKPGRDRMQAIKKLAAIFEEMARAKATQDTRTDPAPRVPPRPAPEQPTPRVPPRPAPEHPPPRVPLPRVQQETTRHPIMTNDGKFVPRRSPRAHAPPQVTQEERAYQLLAIPLPSIKKSYAFTDISTGQQLEYRQMLQWPDLKPIWEKAFANGLGRLSQGIRDIKGRNTIAFISESEIPRDRTFTYRILVCDIRPNKAKQHRVRLKVGGGSNTQEKWPLRIPILRHPNVSGTALYQPKMHDTCAQILKNST